MTKKLLAVLILTAMPAFNASGSETFEELVKQQKPNVVFILADDLGWRDLSCTGSTFYESPNIDRIANEGIRFVNGYAACQVCSPSRASIMTGKYPARLHITDYIGAPYGKDWKRNTKLLPAKYNFNLALDETTMAETFQAAGYKTFFAGKWHLGNKGSYPEDHGFDINMGGHQNGSPPGGFFSPYKNPKLANGPNGENLPLRLGQETSAFIEAHQDRPFFAYLSFYSVHSPIQTTRERWAKFRDKANLQPLADSRFIVDRTSPVRQVQDHPVYAGMVEAMDDAVGEVLNTLDRLKLTENTIVVFTSDNGGVSAGDGKATSNLPLRGGKGRQWEGGIREPLIIRFPKQVKAGSTNSTPVIGTDLYPTLLELATLPLRPAQHLDGLSLVPLLADQPIKERSLFWHYPHYGNQGGEPSSIIRAGNWKLIHYYEDGRNELYDIASDIGEQSDLAAKNPELEHKLLRELQSWLEETDAAMPTKNENFDPVKDQQQRLNTRNVTLPRLEKQHAQFLDKDFVPNGGWWEHKAEKKQ